jgi:hypothetical protein
MAAFNYSNAGGSSMKKYFVVLCIAAVHFVATKLVTMITYSVFAASADETRVSAMGHLLMMVSRVLYFPVMTMAWYPRRFFPGDFIVIPMFVNSLIWAIVIFLFFVFIKRGLFAKKRQFQIKH